MEAEPSPMLFKLYQSIDKQENLTFYKTETNIALSSKVKKKKSMKNKNHRQISLSDIKQHTEKNNTKRVLFA